MRKLNLVYATDANYLRAVEISAMSAKALCSRPGDLALHILDCGITDEAWEAFGRRIGPCVRHRIDVKRFAGFPLWHGSLGTYARLCLPELLDGEEWCVYADGDTLFADDIFSLEPCRDASVALLGHTTSFTTQPAWYAREGLELCREQYVCAGFLLMNLAWLRAHRATEWCLRFLREHPDAPFPDQDALNLCCKGHIRFLPDPWGDFSGAAFGKAPRPGCVHYVGELPWRLEWKWYMGYSDAAAAWHRAAEGLCGIPYLTGGGASRSRWILGRLHNRLVRLALPLLCRLPVLRRRFPNLRNRFASKANRPLLSRAFWGQTGNGPERAGERHAVPRGETR